MQTIEILKRLQKYNTFTKMLTLGLIFVGLQFFPEFSNFFTSIHWFLENYYKWQSRILLFHKIIRGLLLHPARRRSADICGECKDSELITEENSTLRNMGGSTDKNWRCFRYAFLSQSGKKPALFACRCPNHRLEAVHDLYWVPSRTF